MPPSAGVSKVTLPRSWRAKAVIRVRPMPPSTGDLGRRAVIADRQLGLFAAHVEVDGQGAAALGEGVLLGVGDRLDREQGQGRQLIGVDDQRVGVDLGADRSGRMSPASTWAVSSSRNGRRSTRLRSAPW
jgi:hypothetical protein